MSLRVAICLPCQDTVAAGFGLDLARLVGYTAKQDIEHTIIQNRGTIIPQQRATLVWAAQEYQATHVLWIDSDMRFPKDALARLLVHDQPVVACNYSRRRFPVLPTAEGGPNEFLFTNPESSGLVEVTKCGMGLMLVQMEVFASVNEPWFQLGYTRATKEYVGEDFYFCNRLKHAGYKILIDQDLSKEVRHCGEMEWTQQHACITRDTYQPKLVEV